MAQLSETLKIELQKRKERNPHYSLRAFARSLKISPAQLSQIISGKRSITLQTIQKVSDVLALSPLQKQEILEEEILSEKWSPEKLKELQLKADEFSLISDWWHFAILSLAKLAGAKNDPLWVSHRIGISAFQAKEALERLTRLKIIADDKKLKQISEPINVVSDIPSPAIQKYHRQILHLAEYKMETTNVEKRDYSAVTFALSEKKIKKARELIEKTQMEISRLCTEKDSENVYVLSCQLFPVTQLNSKENPS